MTTIAWTNERRKLSDLQPWPRNPRTINNAQAERLVESFGDFGQVETLAIGPDGEIYNGHQRLAVLAQENGLDHEVDVRVASRPLSEKEREKLTVYLHKGAAGEWNFDLLADFDMDDLLDWGFEAWELGLDEPEPELAGTDTEPQINRADELRQEWGTESGQMWQLGAHRLICGDCTNANVVKRLLGGEKARMIFTDPPYGIGKDIENDELTGQKRLDFYRRWTDVALCHAIENAYVYVWGYFDTLSDYWQEVIKPRGDCNFRNFIVWSKNSVQGINSEEFRQFPENYEACLLYIFGQPFQNGPWSTSPNAGHYWGGFDPIRSYLDGERQKMGWDIPFVKKLVGHSDISRDHWFNKSQWSMPTREVYEIFRRQAKGEAFGREYDDLRREYDDLRGHFDNTNGYTDLWQFDRLTSHELHPTVKPLEVCERGIISTSKEEEIVLDCFVGSGTTIIAAHNLGRIARAVEISPAYCAVVLQRFLDHTGITPELLP